MPLWTPPATRVRNPFPGNIIPTNLLNPIALAVTQYMPLPNQAAPPGSAYASSNLSIPSFFDKDKFYNLILKFDANIGSKHRAFFRHLSNDRTEDRAVNGIDNKPGTDGQQPFQRINDALRGGLDDHRLADRACRYPRLLQSLHREGLRPRQ